MNSDVSACNVIYINTVDVESLSGPPAIERAVNVTFDVLKSTGVTTTLAHFKLSSQGITITDNKRRFLYRRRRCLFFFRSLRVS